MENLPVEVISHIIKYLSSIKDRKVCSLVSKIWYEAYQDPYFRNFECVHITSDNIFINLTDLHNKHRKYLHCVIKDIEISENSLEFWDRFGPNLKELSICNCDIRQKIFFNVLRTCHRLESLCIKSCRELFMVGQLLENESERLILKEKLKSLVSLNLSYNRYLSDAVFVNFISVFTNIKKLSLAGCPISFFSGVYKRYYLNSSYSLSESVLTFPVILNYIQNNAEQLNYLSFNDTFIDNAAIRHICDIKNLVLTVLKLRGCFQLSHEGILLICTNQKSLVELDVSLCPRVTDGSLLTICCELKNLKSLSVQRCRAISDLGIISLTQLEKLEKLNISECDLIEGEGIIKGICHRINTKLEELYLSHLRNMTADAVIFLSKSLPNLKVFDLGFCYRGVTDRSVQAILENNRFLRTLILTTCEQLTDIGLTGLVSRVKSFEKPEKNNLKLPLGSKAEIEILRKAKLEQEVQEFLGNSSDFSGFSLQNLKGLKHLDLSGCCKISDVTLIYGIQLRDLRKLNLSHCNHITERGLEYLSKNNSSIEYLDIGSCQNVNDEGVYHVVRNLKRLDTLILGSNKITDNVANLIIKNAKDLIYLDITGCNQVSSEAVHEIIKGLPSLQNFQFSSSKFDDVDIPLPPNPIGLWLKQK